MPMGPVRRPSFLASVTEEGAARPASFARVPGARLASPAPARTLRPEAPALDVQALEAIRAEAMQKVAHAVEVLRLTAERLAEQARSDALEIGFHVARRIVEAELQTSPETLFGLVRSALKRAGDSRKVVIRLHPEDARVIAATVASGDLAVAAAGVEVRPDATLERGDCLVDTDFGQVDGRLQTRLEELHRAAAAAAEEGAA
jgi:flagellar assembly protein FliH